MPLRFIPILPTHSNPNKTKIELNFKEKEKSNANVIHLISTSYSKNKSTHIRMLISFHLFRTKFVTGHILFAFFLGSASGPMLLQLVQTVFQFLLHFTTNANHIFPIYYLSKGDSIMTDDRRLLAMRQPHSIHASLLLSAHKANYSNK